MTDQQKLSKYLKYNEQEAHFSMSIEQMAIMKTELIWLYNHLEIKGDESKRRTGKDPSKEYMQSILTVKRASLFITEYCVNMEQLLLEKEYLKSEIRLLKSKLPKIDMKDYKITIENGKLIYKKNDNF